MSNEVRTTFSHKFDDILRHYRRIYVQYINQDLETFKEFVLSQIYDELNSVDSTNKFTQQVILKLLVALLLDDAEKERKYQND